MVKTIKKLTHDFLNLLYPELCGACETPLLLQEKVICTKCEYEMPRTNFHKIPGNPLEQVFWGRVNVENATALFYYLKESKYQKLIHNLKYHNRKDIGVEMGKWLGIQISQEERFNNIDYIVPVPLHHKKQRKRGYNQSEQIAIGISKQIDAIVDIKNIRRKVHTKTQTKKHRYERWENMIEVFGINNHQKYENKHILLVDDIVTTGATIESCILAFNGINGIKISVATLGFASF